MKGKTKTQKGITLIALIITIVVLLILAVVTIGAIKNDGIISYADNSATKYKDAQTKEEGTLGYYESYLAGTLGTWKKEGDTITKTNKDGTKTEVKIGDTLTNAEVLAGTGETQSSYTGTWTVLGLENGRLKLVSTTNVTTSSVVLGDSDPNVYKKDEDGNPTTELKDEIVEVYGEIYPYVKKAIWSYQHVVETLDGYAKAATGIESARSITIEDLEAKDVLNITNEKKVELSNGEYWKTFNYFYNTDESKVSSRNKAVGSDTWSDTYTTSYASQVFINKDGEIVEVDSENDEVPLDYTEYNYSFTDEQKTKFANSLANGFYWLASRCVKCESEFASFMVLGVVNGDGYQKAFFSSRGETTSEGYLGVRAIVYI